MILFAGTDIQNKRRVVLNGKVVTIIGLRGSEAQIAEDGKWYQHRMFFPLMKEDTEQEVVDTINLHIAEKRIATLVTEEIGAQLVLEDNTRLMISYDKNGAGIVFSVIDSDGKKVL